MRQYAGEMDQYLKSIAFLPEDDVVDGPSPVSIDPYEQRKLSLQSDANYASGLVKSGYDPTLGLPTEGPGPMQVLNTLSRLAGPPAQRSAFTNTLMTPVDAVRGGVNKMVYGLGSLAGGMLPDALGGRQIERAAGVMTAAQNTLDEEYDKRDRSQYGDTLGWWSGKFRGALSSLTQTGITAAVTGGAGLGAKAGLATALGTAGATTAGESLYEAKKAGASDAQASAYAAAMGTLEAGTGLALNYVGMKLGLGKLGYGNLENIFNPKAVTAGLKPMLLDVAKRQGAELLEELTTTLGQKLTGTISGVGQKNPLFLKDGSPNPQWAADLGQELLATAAQVAIAGGITEAATGRRGGVDATVPDSVPSSATVPSLETGDGLSAVDPRMRADELPDDPAVIIPEAKVFTLDDLLVVDDRGRPLRRKFPEGFPHEPKSPEELWLEKKDKEDGDWLDRHPQQASALYALREERERKDIVSWDNLYKAASERETVETTVVEPKSSESDDWIEPPRRALDPETRDQVLRDVAERYSPRFKSYIENAGRTNDASYPSQGLRKSYRDFLDTHPGEPAETFVASLPDTIVGELARLPIASRTGVKSVLGESVDSKTDRQALVASARVRIRDTAMRGAETQYEPKLDDRPYDNLAPLDISPEYAKHLAENPIPQSQLGPGAKLPVEENADTSAQVPTEETVPVPEPETPIPPEGDKTRAERNAWLHARYAQLKDSHPAEAVQVKMQLATENKDLVAKIAWQVAADFGIDVDTLKQQGMLRLLDGVPAVDGGELQSIIDSYDPEKGKFTTHATPHIRGYLKKYAAKLKRERGLELTDTVAQSPQMSTVDPPSPTEQQEEAAEKEAEAAAIKEAQASLDPQSRDVLTRRVNGEKYSQIAADLGISEYHVKKLETAAKLHIAGRLDRVDEARQAMEKAKSKQKEEKLTPANVVRKRTGKPGDLGSRVYDPDSPARKVDRPQIDAVNAFAKAVLGKNSPALLEGMLPSSDEARYDPTGNSMRVPLHDGLQLTHELGHALLTQDHALSDALDHAPAAKAINLELENQGRALYKDEEPEGGYRNEGFAEFIRHALTNPAYVESNMPETLAFWREYVSGLKSAEGGLPVKLGLRKPLTPAQAWAKAVEMMAKWNGKTDLERAMAFQDSNNSPENRRKQGWARFWGGIQNLKGLLYSPTSPAAFYTKEADRLNAERSAREGVKASPKLGTTADPAFVAFTYKGVAAGQAEQFNERGTLDWQTGQVNGAGWKQLLEGYTTDKDGKVVKTNDGIAGKGKLLQAEFEIYLQARLTQALLGEDGQPTKNTGMTADHAANFIEELERKYPQFAPMAAEVQGFWKRLGKFLSDASPGLKAKQDAMEEAVGFYVPAKRLFDELEPAFKEAFLQPGRSTGSRVSAATVARHMTGSDRKVQSMLEASRQEVYSRMELITHRVVYDAAIGLANEPGYDKFVADVTPEADTLRQRAEGGDRDSAKTWSDWQNRPDIEQVFEKNDAEGKPVYKYYKIDAGMRNVLEQATIGDAALLAGTAAFMGEGVVSKLAQAAGAVAKVVEKPNQVFKGMATTFKPAFTLLTGPLQDISSYFFKTQEVNPLRSIVDVFQAYRAAVYHAVTGKSTDKELQAFIRSGLLHAAPNRSNTPNSYQALEKLAGTPPDVATKYGWNVLSFVQQAADLIQSGTQIAELKALGRKAGKNIDEMSHGERVSALHDAKSIMPFADKGTAFTYLDRMVPFLSVPITAGKGLVLAGQRNPKLLALRMGTAFALGLVAYAAMKDDEEWQKADDRTKAGGYFFKAFGQSYYIPYNNLELRSTMGLAQALMVQASEQDSSAAKTFIADYIDQVHLGLGPVPEFLVKQGMNRKTLPSLGGVLTGEAISGRGQIVDTRKAAADNRDETTSGFASVAGNVTGIAPTRIDSALKDLTAGGGANLARSIDILTGTKRAEASDTPVIGAFTRKGGSLGMAARGRLDKLYDATERINRTPEAQLTPQMKLVRRTLDGAVRGVNDLAKMAADAPTQALADQYLRQAVRLAEQALAADQRKIGAPSVATQANRIRKLRERLRLGDGG